MGKQAAVSSALSRHSGKTPLEFSVDSGQRILCLDGGGLKGLIMIEVLIHIEGLTGKKITELFDWIVGTSTGGIIALGLVYGISESKYSSVSHISQVVHLYFYAARKSLHQLKQLYFELKEEVFSSGNKYGYGFDTKKKERVLLRYFDPEMKMTAIMEPK